MFQKTTNDLLSTKRTTANPESRVRMNARQRTVDEKAIVIVEAALLLPIYLMLVLGGAWLYLYIRNFMAVGYAAQRAAEIAAIQDGLVSVDYNKDNEPERAYLNTKGWDQCRGLLLFDSGVDEDSKAAAYSCLNSDDGNPLGNGRYGAIAAAGTSASSFDPAPDSIVNLPFALFDSARSDSSYPIQSLPFVSIRYACFETRNESDATIDTDVGRIYQPQPEDNDACHHVRPMYWKIPLPIDFDGDLREDLVFFTPRGTSQAWGDDAGAADLDFIVYLSSEAYRASRVLYMNLTRNLSIYASPVNAPIPVVADYDRDGLSDFAVYEPATATVRIAYSKSRYRAIGEGTIGALADNTGEKGTIAIPGNYLSTEEVQLAITNTGGAAAQRFAIYVTGLQELNPVLSNNYPALNATPIPLDLTVTTFNTEAVKPHPGTVSVPGPADVDDDGRTEWSWLSYYGGSLAKRVGGDVPALNANLATARRFEYQGGAVDVDSSFIDFILNPFDMEVDQSGNLFIVDSVDSRLIKVSRPEDNPRGEFGGSNAASIYMPSTATISQPTVTTENLFPSKNVYNVPVDARSAAEWLATSDAANLSVNSRILRNPRKIVVAHGYENVMYIADWGNGRIVRVDLDSDTSRIVLGSDRCAELQEVTDGDGCGASGYNLACEDLPMGIPGAASDSDNASDWNEGSCAGSLGVTPGVVPGGRFAFYPSALEIIPHPDDSSRYMLAFSAGNQVYLIEPKPGALNKGPRGEAGETVYLIAGQANAAPGESEPVPSGDLSTYRFSQELDGAGDAHNSKLCPIIDLKYDTTHDYLLASASCSLTRFPFGAEYSDLNATAVASNITRKNVGGIYKIVSDIALSNGTADFRETNTVSVFMGGFWYQPCQNGKCSGPANSSAAGVYQRKINIAASIAEMATLDMINPVDLEFGPQNSLLFIDQWNDSSDSTSGFYPNSPNRTDSQHQQGIYLVERNAG
ncbi:MAG: hypothetical protein KDD42_05165, partial [Bdellovibrionales bacterium]|nr:hypothetical protein [Bdellovibrionales bacterium]